MKPYIIKVAETEEKIVDVLNKSGLEPYTLKNILTGIYQQLDEIEKNQINEYQQELNKKDNKEIKNKKPQK